MLLTAFVVFVCSLLAVIHGQTTCTEEKNLEYTFLDMTRRFAVSTILCDHVVYVHQYFNANYNYYFIHVLLTGNAW